MFLAVPNSKEENSMLALLPATVVDHEKVFNLNMLNILTCERELLLSYSHYRISIRIKYTHIHTSSY